MKRADSLYDHALCVSVYMDLDFCHIQPNLMKICVKIIKLVSTPSPYYY